jgi:primosomal replication protein N
MQALYVRLLEGFDWHGQDIGPMRRLGDGNRIVVVAFIATHERRNMLCG